MKAKIITGAGPKNDRVRLGEALPFELPLATVLSPSSVCNFKCKYCIHGHPDQKSTHVSSAAFMDYELYQKYIYGIKDMGAQLKRLNLSGAGEPLLHKNIVDMVRLAKQTGAAQGVEITTNGACLTKELSDGLIDAQLDMLRVSIQGLTDEKYQEVSGISLKVDELVEKLKYFYEHKKNTVVYIKIVDCALDDEKDDQRFYDMFGDVCDLIAVESLIDNNAKIDFNQLAQTEKLDKTLYGTEMLYSDICVQPFYTMLISSGGEVAPCCSLTTPMVIGDLKKESIQEICNGDTLRRFRYQMLCDRKKVCKVCKECDYYYHLLLESDVLDEYREKLIEVYKDK